MDRPEEPPPTDELRHTFASNVAGLLDLLGKDRKQAAGAVGVPYKWLWRMATKGIARTDDRHRPNLQRLADYFLVPSVDDFWQVGLLHRLISAVDPTFRRQFEKTLRSLYQAEVGKLRAVNHELLTSLKPFTEITGIKELNPAQPSITTMDKFERLIATGRYEELRQILQGFEGIVNRFFEEEQSKTATRDVQAS